MRERYSFTYLGPLVISITDNIVGSQFPIRAKYKESVQMLRNFMGYQLSSLFSKE